MLEPELYGSRMLSPFWDESGDEELSVLPRHTKMKETQQEANAKPETVKEKDIRETVAVDLSKRLRDLHSVNDATSFKGRSATDMEALF